jgi:hypothetical protein
VRDRADAADLAERFRATVAAARAYDERQAAGLERSWRRTAARWVPPVPASATRVGIVLGTFSPVHRGHLALIEQAVDDLRLDHVLVIVWPFARIPGFHPRNLRAWAREQTHLDWAGRVELLRIGLAGLPASVVAESKTWYLESRGQFSSAEYHSSFWTGMWYVARKLRWLLDHAAGTPRTYHQLCGADQFNRHVGRLLRPDANLPWTDYSIGHLLAAHNVYAVPRDEVLDPLEGFQPPGCANGVTLGRQARFADVTASAIRNHLLPVGRALEDAVPGPVAERVRRRGWWGY